MPSIPRYDHLAGLAFHDTGACYRLANPVQPDKTYPAPRDPRIPPAHRHSHPGHLRHASDTPPPDDTCDWWSLPYDELLEINAGAIAFLNLPSDGTYPSRLQASLTNEEGSVYLLVPSGQVFIGAGEDTTGGGLEPDGSDVNRGQFITLDKGTCCMR